MSRLIHALMEDPKQASDLAWRRYAELLQKPRKTDAETKELETLLLNLGRQPKDMEADHKVIMEVRRHQELIHDGSGSGQESQEDRKAMSALQLLEKGLSESRPIGRGA